MPGNEVGDRVHNFFDQGSLSQDQRHTQFVEANWPGFNNNVWGANESQNDRPLNTSSKNYSGQQSEIERAQTNQFSLASRGLNFSQSSVRPEFVKSPSQVQQSNLNGFMHTSQVVNARQSEANFLGVDRGTDRPNMTSRGLSVLESQQRSVPQHSNSASFGGSEAPMNFNFLGGQQQMSGQQPGMLQSLPQQQPGINDAQLMHQQQVMFKQIQELQRRQQVQQFEAMQRNAMNHMPTFPNQSVGQHSQTINGNTVQDTSNYPWQSQVMASGTNWQQRGHPGAVHGYTNGVMVAPEQGQAMRFMGLIPQQGSQSLYGVPVSNSGGGSPFSQNSMDKQGGFHLSAPTSSFSGNPYAPHAEQVSMQDASTPSRSGSEGKNSFLNASSQGLENTGNLGGFNQVQNRRESMSDGGGRIFVGGSDVSPEKTLVQAAASQSTSSQAAAGLDPTEEKILFGNDDNIWEAFGAGASAAVNDGADLFNGFPSMQSGTWSALMQSAVAETSSGDVGTQEEWSGLESQNSRPQSGNQHLLSSQDNEKSPPVWVDSSQRASLGSRTTSNDLSADNATLNTNYSLDSRLQQPFPNQRSSPIENQEGRRWLDSNSPKPHAEDKKAFENPSSSRGKVDAAFWSHRQSTFLPDSVPDSNISSKGGSGGPGLSNMNMSHESSQRPPNSHSLDLWKSVNFATNPENVGSGNDRHIMHRGQSVLDSSVTSPGGVGSEMHGTENGHGRENSSDSHQNSFQNHALAGSLRENVWSDAGDRQFMPGASEISSSNAGRGVSVPRKFQYHPMGDVDVDDSSSGKQVLRSQSMFPSSPKLHETPLGPSGLSASDMEKGRISGFHGGVKMLHGGLSSGVNPGYVPSPSAPFARPGENSSPNQRLSPSQNMLELLHKVDQTKDQHAISNLGSTNYNRSSDIPTGGHAGPGQSQPSTSHGFNLQLAPPSQGTALSNFSDPGQSSLRSVGSPNSRLVPSEKGDNTNTWLPSGSSTQCLPPSHRPPQMDAGNDKSGGLEGSQSNLKGNASASFASNSTYLRNPFQNQHMTAGGDQMMGNHQSTIISSDRLAYHNQQSSNSQHQVIGNQSVSNLQNNLASERDRNQSGMRASMHQMPPSMHPGMAGMRKDNMSLVGPYLWNSEQQLLGAQARNADFVKSHFQSTDASDMNSISQQKKDELDGRRSTDVLSSQGVAGGEDPTVVDPRSFGKTVGVSQEESLGRQSMEVSPSDSAASQKDADVFHHTSRSNNMAQTSYSLLNQMQAMNSMGMDPSHREAKRLKGPDNGPDAPDMAGMTEEPSAGGMSSMVRDPAVSQASVSSVDARMLSFSPQLGNRNISSRLPHGAVASQDMLSFGRSDPQTFVSGNIASRALLSGISPQMAPSWFEQYGTYRNGQLLPVHNVPRVPMVRNVDQQLIKPSDLVVQNPVQLENTVTDTSQIASTSQITNVYSASEHVSPLHALGRHVSSPIPVSTRPKKRKTATSDLLPWNKEIGQCFKRIQNMSSAEVEWAQSSNRLVERGGDETDFHEDMSPMVRPRRRLILTTKLMQQVFSAPSASVLSLDGRSNYELITYSIARLALGDACNLICSVESDSPPDNNNSLSGKVQTSERIRDQHFSKVVEDFSSRAKELENDFLRLDKRASILDFRLDCQDLERFAVINRFARFHGRSQVDGVETSSSSDANAISQKPCPQRFVTAHPMPRTVPERVQCLTIN